MKIDTRQFTGYAVFLVIIGLIVAVVIIGPNIGKTVSQADKMSTSSSYNLSMINADPYRVNNLTVRSTANLTISAMYTQNGSASGGLKVVTNNLTFESLNPNIATVSPGGQITGVAAGSTSVNVTYTYHNVTKSVIVPVTVTAPTTT